MRWGLADLRPTLLATLEIPARDAADREIRCGIERLPDGKRKTQLRIWLQAICDCMTRRVLGFNTGTAEDAVVNRAVGGW